jgi:hypothetical protein
LWATAVDLARLLQRAKVSVAVLVMAALVCCRVHAQLAAAGLVNGAEGALPWQGATGGGFRGFT